ncbi:MAG TPA: TonB family protein [Steroidobacteraceae bacterium]|jgi:periplasmic protein TonB|nr:TonB family protein [Steroidobacteraceae bacterium]
MSVGDLYDVERTGEFAVTRVRRRSKQASYDPAASVPITVLTDDSTLADAIHDAAAANHPVATASTLDEALELAANGRCAILITDQLSTQSALRQMTQRLRQAEPALVVVAVGTTGDQNGLISLLSAGIVDRLMLKPVTPSLAQIVLKSAVQQHRTLQGAGTAVTLIEPQSPQPEPAVVLVELQRHAANDMSEARLDLHPSPAEVVAPASTVGPAAPSRPKDIPRPPWIAVVAALLAVAGLMWWIAAERRPSIDPQAVIATNLAAAQRAFREGHSLEPRGQSAIDYYNTVLALEPANAAAHQGIDQIADRFAVEAGMAIARGQMAAAIVALDSLRRVRPEHRRLQELEAQLNAAQETLAAAVPARMQPTPEAPKAPPAAVKPALQQHVEAQARAVAEAAAALKRDQQELANAQQQFAAKIEAAEAQLAAVHKEKEVVAPLPAVALVPAAAAPAAPTPRLARMVRPEYPSEALRTGAEGWVNVSVAITPAGNVVDPRVEQSSNGTLFNRAALAAVRKWRYEPFASADPLASQRVLVRVEFRMEERH